MHVEHFGNPFIFEDIKNYLQDGKVAKTRSKEEIFKVLLKHLQMELEEKGDYTGIREMRKHISYYTKGMENGSSIRNYINTITDKDELIRALKEFFK